MSCPENLPDNFVPYGYFKTVDATTVTSSTHEQPIEYLRNMYEDQFEYFAKANKIIIYTSANLVADPGEFDLRVFYDKIQ